MPFFRSYVRFVPEKKNTNFARDCVKIEVLRGNAEYSCQSAKATGMNAAQQKFLQEKNG